MKNQKSMIINMNELQLNRRKFTTTEIGRGVGVTATKKGRGSYTRKRKNVSDEAYFKTTYVM